MKRIAIFCDGTWETPDRLDDGKPAPTNVTKLAEAVFATTSDHGKAGAIKQLVFYHTGVGTYGSIWKRICDGYTGFGVSRTICEAYRYVIERYEPGDQLFLFGFSRGAFTVRSLAGMIRNCRVLRREDVDLIPKAFSFYRSRYPATQPRTVEADLFRRTYAVEDITPIEFVGVWDTVGALGNPLVFGNLSPENKFHDTNLSTTIRHAYHALAIDEQRVTFKPTLWKRQRTSTQEIRRLMGSNADGTVQQVLEQVWFCGVHCDVGGGYAQTGLSDIAMQWMRAKAEALGLEFDALPAKGSISQAIGKSLTWLYRWLGKYDRPIAVPGTDTCESVHFTVAQRFHDEPDYRPPELAIFFAKHPAIYAQLLAEADGV
jgi:uncharacterized protein (DUF2235 family)